MDTEYTDAFFMEHQEGSRQSAECVVPLLIDLVHPQSVIDVGCGTGTWLAVFAHYGVTITGIDGDYVNRSMLQIPPDRFLAHDLTRPVHLGKTYDLVVSLEVAEHLPPERARTFVASLARLGSVIAFSAAIPGQGGTDHRNEQWQDYWAALFRAHGYHLIDAIRPRIWQNSAVEPHYIQNILMYATQERIDASPEFQDALASTRPGLVNLVHPAIFLRQAHYHALTLRYMGFTQASRRAAVALIRAVARRIR